jgi:hypothetical protein
VAGGVGPTVAAGPWRHLPPGDLADLPPGRLDEATSGRLFAHYGIPVVRGHAAATPEEAEAAARQLGPQVVLKVVSPDLPHKSDVSGVLLGVPATAVAERGRALLAAVAARCPQARLEGLLVQEQIDGGVEAILGYVRDPQLGPTIHLGAGGIAAELLGDSVVRLAPLTPDDAAAMIRGLRSYPLFTGYRGRPPCDLPALAACLVAFSAMVVDLGERLAEAEINPLLVLPAGQGVRAADALVVLDEVAAC